MILVTVHQGRLYQAKSMLEMCQVLTNRGLNKESNIFDVYDLTSGDFVGELEYEVHTDTWVSTTKYRKKQVQGITKSEPPKIQCKACSNSQRTDKATEYWCRKLEHLVSPWEPPHDCPCKVK